MPARFSSFASDDSDPLAAVMLPPPNETPEQRAIRLEHEQEARRVSDAIDELLKQEKLTIKKKKTVKLLLLGQGESGKSTTLRQFQRIYTPSAFREERILWRAVIQLNLVRSIRTILENLSNHAGMVAGNLSGGEDSEQEEYLAFSDELDRIRLRLLPLRSIEALLISKLVAPGEDEATHFGFVTYDEKEKGRARSIGADTQSLYVPPRRPQEVFVRPGAGWKGAVARGTGWVSSIGKGRPMSAGAGSAGIETPDEATAVLHACREDMMALWADPKVREILKYRKVRLEEQPGFFLNDMERITTLRYFPSDDDVLRARLKTVGVAEYRFEMESAAGREAGTEWRIIDVGGSRSQRQTWIPFFDEVDAIIFLAPISGFDQVLAEDKSVNRLEDSVLLWKMICSNKLLARVDLVLFLNKYDLLERKLKSGTRIARYVKSYQDRANDAESVQKYFRSKFSAIHREYSPNPRKFYGFTTSVTEITATSGIIASVRDMVVREHLKKSKLL